MCTNTSWLVILSKFLTALNIRSELSTDIDLSIKFVLTLDFDYIHVFQYLNLVH